MMTKITASSRVDRLLELNRIAELGGGKQRLERQKAEGKLTARARISLLLDKDSFEELDKFVRHRCLDFGMQEQQYPGDGVVAGYVRLEAVTQEALGGPMTHHGISGVVHAVARRKAECLLL